MRTLFAIAALFTLVACGTQEVPPEESSRAERLLATEGNTVALNHALPALALDWRPHDGQLDDGEATFLNVVQRLRLDGFYTSSDAELVTPAPCFYHREASPGTILVRTSGGELWLLAEVDGIYGSGRHTHGRLNTAQRLLFARRYTTYVEQDYIAVGANDINRFVNITEVLCPEDGEPYEDAWMEYRFPRLARERQG